MTFIPQTITLKDEHRVEVTIPVIVTNAGPDAAPQYGSIARNAGLRGRDVEPLWTVVFTGGDGAEHRQCRDQLSRYNAFAARGFASDLVWNGITVLRFEVTTYQAEGDR